MATELRRSLSLTQLTFYGVGTIVGAGIYSVLGAAAGIAGQGVWVSLLLAGLAALLTGLSYAELVARYPRAGAEYHFLKAAFPRRRLPAFLAGYLIALNAAATAATVALAFGGYWQVFFAGVPAWLPALVLLLACTGLNVLGIRQTTWVGMGVVVIEVGGLLLLVGAGAAQAGAAATVTLPPLSAAPSLLVGAAVIFFIYIGFEEVANLAEESQRPDRDVPRALLLSIVFTTLVYLLVTWVVMALVSPATLAASASPLTTAAAAIDPRLGPVLAVSALFSTASTALITLVSISRLLFGMARDGALPAALARVSESRRVPWVAALLLLAAACALLPLGRVEIVASIASLGVLSVFAAVHVAVIRLRFTDPAPGAGFRVPGAMGRLPLLPVVGLLMVLALVTQFPAEVYAVAGGALALGLALRALAQREALRAAGRSGPPSAGPDRP